MGKAQKKTGKGRLDKYYKLAKEQGYRARSAFKLIQLNKKYGFLESARCTIDLCAAPGGWLQVASKYMPVNSVIVGVDLVPIKPIPRVVTFAADITTPHCRNLIRGELKDWRADVVLHDGAPNVGTAWIQDAYSQSELVLMSLKLAVEFLVKGGTFVTKVFRSVDYNNLIWVFNQLFGKVEATKPPSSRNVSAEIFVVCRDFLAPKFIDPKFLDPKHVFKDLSSSIPSGSGQLEKGTSANNAQMNVFQPDKKRRKREGYADGDYTLFHKVPAAEFVRAQDPVLVLGTANQITFETEEEKEWLANEITTEDIKANCADLKVLGKGDFKALLRWRTALREELGLESKTKDTEELTETVEITQDIDEEEQIQDELERLNTEAAARTKRQRRRANELKTKTIQRMQLQMTAPLDIGLSQNDPTLALGGQEDIFDLNDAERRLSKNNGGVMRLVDEDGNIGDESDDDGEAGEDESDEGEDVLDSEEEVERKTRALEAEMDGMYDAYQSRLKERDAKYKVREERRKHGVEEWRGIRKPAGSDEDDSGDDSGEQSEDGGWDKMEEAKERAGEDSDSSSDEDSDMEDLESPKPKAGVKRRREEPPELSSSLKSKKSKLVTTLDEPPKAPSQAAKVWFSQDVFAGVDGLDNISNDEEMSTDGEDEELADETAEQEEWVDEASEDEEGSEDDYEIAPQEQDDDVEMWDVENEDEDAVKQEKIKKSGLLTAEAVTLAQALVNRQTTKTHLINDGFSRYSLNSKDGLPDWFLDDEAKYYKPNIPITKEAVAALRAKQRALDARPIKKIAEAKARKKFKAAQRLEKAMKKAEGVNETADMSEREKARQIEKLMRKGLSSQAKAKKEIKVVVAKGAHRGVKGRPKGVKGRYQMVDARMRKETRAKKRKEKASKKRKH